LLDHPEAFAGWLSTITRRESWRFKRRAEPGAETTWASIEESSMSADESIERTEQRFQVERGLEQLDDRCRRLLTMLFFSDPAPSYDDIAEQLGMKVSGKAEADSTGNGVLRVFLRLPIASVLMRRND
jgi:DNA-directed RNA polymerase specialized sigma24 family protein